MPQVSESDLRKRAYAVEGRTVLIEGAEALLKARALKGIVDAALPADAQPYALRTVECDKSPKGVHPNAAEIMAEAQTPAFLSPHHVVVVREIQRLPVDEERKLAKWIVNVPADALLILVTGADGAAGKHLGKAVAKEGTLVTADLPKTKRKDAAVAWVREEAKALGKEIEPAAAQYLVWERTDSDLARIRAELEKLALYAADAPKITRQHVEEVTPRSIEGRIWDLTDAITQGDCAKALPILHELLQERRQPPELVLGGIAGQVRRIWQVKCLLDLGWRPGKEVPESAAGVLLGGRASVGRDLAALWRAQKSARQAGEYAWPALHAALRRLAACDLAIKGIEGGDDKAVALDLLVAALCARRRPARV